MDVIEQQIKLTAFSHGAGCGCKIAPAVLDSILKSSTGTGAYEKLLVGNDERDDAAVYMVDEENAVISTTDFFMPIVDSPFDFGRIASANAISDIYAMGGKPLMAIAVLGWPINKLAPEIAREVLEGSRSICREAGIPLAGGHSIDNPEPLFGLAVTGIVKAGNLKKNSTASEGCLLYLTKPLGVGILSTAQKKGLVNEDDFQVAVRQMCALNKIGQELSTHSYVKALTDVTGFGLLGHLSEMCEGSGLSATIEFNKVPVLDEALKYIELGCIPGGTRRNMDSYGHKVSMMTQLQTAILADPQTSGGLLIAVEPDAQIHFETFMAERGFKIEALGQLHAQKKMLISVD